MQVSSPQEKEEAKYKGAILKIKCSRKEGFVVSTEVLICLNKNTK